MNINEKDLKRFNADITGIGAKVAEDLARATAPIIARAIKRSIVAAKTAKEEMREYNDRARIAMSQIEAAEKEMFQELKTAIWSQKPAIIAKYNERMSNIIDELKK